MGQDAIQRLKNTVIFQALLKAESSLGGHELSELAVHLVERVSPILERIPERMPEFTLHDPNHSAKVLELIALIVPRAVLEHLNAVELTILIAAGYLHDIGMTCSTEERDSIIAGNTEFRALLVADEDRERAYQAAIHSGNHRAVTRIEDATFVDYLRLNHVNRSDTYIAEIATTLNWHGSPFGKWVRAVCRAHGCPVSALLDESAYPRDALVRNLRINVQYLALLLRLGDILDLDPERTPDALFVFINPTDATSIQEWHKHRSVIGWEITPERVIFEAECTHPSYERALRTFIDWIELERRDSLLLLGRHHDAISKEYYLDLVHAVTADRIRSNGTYIYTALRFVVDYKRVINLLSGVNLYKDPLLALRELLQNAADAVRHRQAEDPNAFDPCIEISLEGSVLSVEDNGIGMDVDIFQNYFVQVGRSYYTSPIFRAKPGFDPVSEFGIGALASFMLAKTVVVESRRYPTDPLHPPTPIHFEIPTASDFFVQRPSSRRTVGTKISLILRDGIDLSRKRLVSTIRQVAPALEFPLQIAALGKSTELQARASLPKPKTSLVALTFPTTEGLLKDVEGTIEIRRKGRTEIALLIAQRGFLVGGRPNEGWDMDDASYSLAQLFPSWTSVACFLNLRGDAKLTLTPDRTDAIRDQRFSRLKESLEGKIIEAINQKLIQLRETSGSPAEFKAIVDDLLDSDVLRGETHSGFEIGLSAIHLMRRHIFVEVIQRTGNIDVVPFVDLGAEPEVAITSRLDWPPRTTPAEVRAATDGVLGRQIPIIVRPEKGEYNFSYILRRIYGENSGVAISGLAGLVLEISSKIHKEAVTFDGAISVLSDVKSVGKAPVIAHGASPTMLQSIYYNRQHPLLIQFMNEDCQPSSKRAEGLVLKLDEQIDELFAGYFSSGPTIFRREGSTSYTEPPRNAINRLMHGFLLAYPTFLPELQELFRQFWTDAQHQRVVDIPFPALTADDLPWFWSAKKLE